MIPEKSFRWYTGRGLVYAAAITIALFVLVPIYIITVLAFSPEEVVRGFPKPLIPTQFSTETISFFLNTTGVYDALLQSVIVAVIALVVSTLLGAPAGYALARFYFRGENAYRLTILATRAFPVVILAVPLVVTYIRIGLDDSAVGVAMLHSAMALPTTVLVTAAVFVGVNEDLEAAALTLGCSRIGAFRRIAFPLALPGLAASAIFVFVLSWNEVFAAAVLTLRNPTLPAQLVTQLNQSPVPFRFAGGFFILVPAIIFIAFVRRYLFNLWGVKLK